MSDSGFADNAALLAALARLGNALIEAAQMDREVASPVNDPLAAPANLMRARLDQATARIAAEWAALDDRSRDTIAAGRFIPWLHLGRLFRLNRTEQALLLLALLPEIDHRYAAVLGSLAERPVPNGMVPLTAALAVLGGAAARPLLRAATAADGVLHRWCLLDFAGEMEAAVATGGYRLPVPVAAFLLGAGVPRPSWGEPLAAVGTGRTAPTPDALLVDASTAQRVAAIQDQWRTGGPDVGGYLLLVRTVDPTAGERVCAALFGTLGLGCVRLDGRVIAQDGAAIRDRLPALCRDLLLSNQVLVLTGAQWLVPAEDRADRLSPLLDRLFDSQRYVAVINGPAGRLSDLAHGYAGHTVVPLGLSLPRPDAGLRQRLWLEALATAAGGLAPDLVERVSAAYQLTATQIGLAAKEAAARHRLGDGWDAAIIAACRAQAEREELAVAREVRSAWRLADVILPTETAEALRDVLLHAHHRDRVMAEWGFGRGMQEGRNLSVLFHGPPGTGKTMAASALANELGLGLYRIDLAGVQSKYIGETEQRLAQLFDQAEAMNIVLFFDEAESLFARRTEAQSSNDRHANLQTGYLLQRIESYPGIVILSTNLLKSLDPAFIRRFQFIVEYPFPGPVQRLGLWRAAFPADAPLAADLDTVLLAERAVMTGGHIREAAVAAAMYAAAEGQRLGMAHVLRGVRREYGKLGQVFVERDFTWAEED